MCEEEMKTRSHHEYFDFSKSTALLVYFVLHNFFNRTNLLSVVKAVMSFDRDGVGRDVTGRRRGRE